MIFYRHRQIGTLMLLTLGFAVALVAVAFFLIPVFSLVPIVILVILFISILSFWSLTVQLDEETLDISFGVGLFRKRYRTNDIANSMIVRNPWYYGWGIKLTRYGWLYNVSGLDAVQVEMKDGRRFRIGSDDCQGLSEAIRQLLPTDN